MIVGAAWWQNPAVIAAFIAAAVAVAGTLATVITTTRGRRHERLEQARARMVEMADEALAAFQAAGQALAPALKLPSGNGPSRAAGARAEYISQAKKLCEEARVVLPRFAMVFHRESPATASAMRIVQTLEYLLRLAEEDGAVVSAAPGERARTAVSPAEAATREEAFATWTLFPIDEARWDADVRYRLAIYDLNLATELLLSWTRDDIKQPFVDYPRGFGDLFQVTYWESPEIAKGRHEQAFERFKTAHWGYPGQATVRRVAGFVRRRKAREEQDE